MVVHKEYFWAQWSLASYFVINFFVKITNKINGAGLRIEIIGLKLVPDGECLRLPFVVEGMK